MPNNLFTLGLDVDATKSNMDKQLKQIIKELSDGKSASVICALDMEQSQKLIQQQLSSMSKNLKIGVQIDASTVGQQIDKINKQMSSGIKNDGVKVPFQFDLSDANEVKAEINKIVADITSNQGKLVKFKINVDDTGQASKALLTYRNGLNEVTNATLKLQNIGKWYDNNGVGHNIVKWSEGQKSLSQNIEATAKANQRQIESDNQVIRKKEELIAQMKLLNTQAEKAGVSLNSDNQSSFKDLSVNASTNDDIKQLNSYLKLARTEFQTFNAEAKTANSTSQGLFGSLKTQLKDTVATMLKYQLAYKIINETVSAVKSMAYAVTDLDAKLTEFNKVADLSTTQLQDFADKAYESADKIGRTGADMIEAATEFKRAGYKLNDSLDMGDAALVMTNVADGITQTSDAAGTLISVLNGFDMENSNIMSIVDKMNEVSNKSPVGFDNLADGLERVSGTMNQAGNSIDETLGMLTGGFAQLRNMEKVSSGLITISQRLRAVDEDGDTIDGLSAELNSAFGSIGVEIEDANGGLRSTYDILKDYAGVLPTLTSKQKQYFGELASGKRQIAVFNAIIDEMSTVDNAISHSTNSVGSAVKENEIYRQSVQGLKNEFDNQFQMLSNAVIDSDWIKNLIIAGTDFLEVLTNIVQQEDLVSGTIGIITDLLKGMASALNSITDNDAVGTMIKGFLTLKTVTKGIDIFNFVKGKNSQQNAINAFFQSALNGTMQIKDGLLQVGEAEKKVFGSGLTNSHSLQARLYKVA